MSQLQRKTSATVIGNDISSLRLQEQHAAAARDVSNMLYMQNNACHCLVDFPASTACRPLLCCKYDRHKWI
jgi:hypothetical protein